MTKIPLVGQSYALRSPTAAAQTCMNLYPELIEDPNEREKNKAFLYGIPGRHVFKDLTTIDAAATPVRGIWTGAGRTFVAAGTKYMELSSTGALIGSVRTISNASVLGFSNTPVYFIPNGNQLFIVSGGVGYIDNGAGPVTITIGNSAGVVTTGYQGVVDTTAGAVDNVVWVSGDEFPTDGSWNFQNIVINGTSYLVTAVSSTHSLTVLVAPGAHSGYAYSFSRAQARWVSGDKFQVGSTWVGKTMVINGSNFTIFSVPDDETANLATVPTPAVGVAYSVAGYTPAFVTAAYLNDSFFANQANTRGANFSGVFRGDLWNGLDLITKDTWPDYVLCVLSNGAQIFLFGTDSFDVFQSNPGSTTTFFSRIDGASCRIGTVSPWSPISIAGNVYMMGIGAQGNPVAYVLDGFTPKRISQHAQEASWQAANLGRGCISYTYTEEGHSFWVTNFGSQTWAFDTTTGAWHQRSTGSGYTAYPTAYHSYIPEFGNGKHLTGGPLNGTIYESSTAFYDDAGADIYWQRALPFQYNGRNRIYDSRLELEMETGTTPSGEPNVALDYSDDRGHTFSTPESASMGAATAYSQRVFWVALGSYFERVYRFSGHSQARIALIDCEAERELGTT
jgi:hypothetical protein